MSDSISKYYERLEDIEDELKAIIYCITGHTIESISEHKCSEIYMGNSIAISFPNGLVLDINLPAPTQQCSNILKKGTCKFGHFALKS